MPSALYESLAPYYDRIYSGENAAGQAHRVEQIARRALQRPGHRLLDVGCGTGRHLVEFRRSFEIAGVDLNRAMLRVARQRLGPGVPLRQGDMRTFDLGATFDVLTCLFSAFGYLLMRRDRDRAAANFYRHLAPGGVALVEGWVLPQNWREGFLDLTTFADDATKIARVTRSYRRRGISTVEMQYLVADGNRPIRHFTEIHRLALLNAEEVLGSFTRAGFRAQVVTSGPFALRGLYVANRPLEDES
jgi:ubiquinone/menaquinone biosynthesis C-methylase UbiE